MWTKSFTGLAVLDHTSSAFEEFLPTSTSQVEKESVSYSSTSESVVSSVIVSTSTSPVASVTTTPTTFANVASGKVSSLCY